MKKIAAKKTQKVYKIVNKDGLCSNGGSMPRFTLRGKIWTNLGHIKNHLNQFDIIPSEWEVIELDIVEIKRFKASDLTPQIPSSNDIMIKNLID